MPYRPSLPWRKIQDYLLELGASRDIQEFYHKSTHNVYSLIPVDVSALFFIGPFQIAESCGADPKQIPVYNDHYSRINPIASYDLSMLTWIDWRDFEDTEFVADFMRPNGVRYSLARYMPSNPISLSIQRSPQSPTFQELHYEILGAINPHLNNIHTYLEIIAKLEAEQVHTAELARGCRVLSGREAEVAALLCQRLSVPVIATKLLVSPHTVQRHIANIYEKLKVGNRRQLLLKLLGDRAKEMK